MKAIVYNGPRDVRYADVDDPKRQAADDAIVRVETTAICGSDLHVLEQAARNRDRYAANIFTRDFQVEFELAGNLVVQTAPRRQRVHIEIGDEAFEFLCVVPNGPDRIEVLEGSSADHGG